jgi:CBS domain-containing protein
MQVGEIMTSNVHLLSPEDSIQSAACQMRDEGIGSLPVSSGDRLVGYVTDRDIAVRGVAAGKKLDAAVSEVMSDRILYCFVDDEIEEVAESMAKNQVRRLPVLTREKRLCGVVSLGDLATRGTQAVAEDALSEISRPAPSR